MISLAIFIFLAPKPVLAQTIYSQDFTSGLGGWAPSSATAIVVNSTSSSDTYTTPFTASGGNNLSFGECGGNTEHSATSPTISTVGQTNIMVGFGRRKTNAFGPQVVIFEFSTDGGTNWTSISSDVSSVATTTWGLSVFTLPTAAENQANLTFRLRYTPPAGASCATAFRIDDFTVSSNGTLPVELAYFRGTAERNGNQLSWETVWERGTSHFVIERSTDAKEFGAIGQVTAVGNAASKRLYTFTDGEPLAGTSYYRLRQVDHDGASQVSKMVFVSRSEALFVVCDNPTSGDEIRLNVANVDPASLQFLTTTGQFLTFQLIQLSATDWRVRPAVRLKPGLYLLRAGQQNQQRTVRVLVR
ncbi:T9SS C-terminal target domain-containing protein [Larkinella punicea]|uniref:T9SS C-terminal target domain-containing protein n=1 Tax=Larkinella punicea TaxID=2315727 RepID=A0A368JXG8_9BACT|nr:T9SS C-terminal target domain-containing protein [Larkinella punicea]